MTIHTIDEIFRDFNIEGMPSSGPFNPHKPDIRDTLKKLLEGVSAFPDNRVIRLNNANEGTANNIRVSAAVNIPSAAFQVLYILNVTQNNTGAVTVSGAINRQLVTNTNAAIPKGYLTAGMAVLCIDTGTTLRMLSYGDMETIVRDAETAQVAAETARDIAAGYASDAVSQGDVPIYSTLASISTLEISAGINAIRVNGRNDVGDGEGGLYIANDNGSDDTGVSGDGRTWWRVNDVGRDRISAAVKSVIKNPYEFGAAGDGIADDGPALRAIFSQAGDIYIPDGNYRVQDDYIRLYSDTNVIMGPRARIINDITNPAWQKSCLFVNGEQGTSNNQGGYENTENIHFTGGVIDGSGRSDRGLMSSLFNIAHHKNISFTDTSIDNYAGNTHAIEINSTDDFYFRRASFDGYKSNGATIGTREAVNIDWSSENGFPEFGPWDGTICRNGLFENCRFKDVDVAIGSHSKPDSILHQNITIRDCIVTNPLTNGFDVRFFDPGNCQFENNKFILEVENTYDYRLEGLAFINGRYLVVLTKDKVVSIPVSRMAYNANGIVNKQGLVLIGGHSSAASSPRGLMWGHFAQAPAINAFAIAPGADQVTYTTGEITGTTGAPGSVTVSAVIGGLMISSRRDATFRLDVKFMGN